jgi:hypothetical protein
MPHWRALPRLATQSQHRGTKILPIDRATENDTRRWMTTPAIYAVLPGVSQC